MSLALRQLMGVWSIATAVIAMIPTFFAMGPVARQAPNDTVLIVLFPLWALSSAGVKLAMFWNRWITTLNVVALIAWAGLVVYVATRYGLVYALSFQTVTLASWVLGWPLTDLLDLMVPERYWTKATRISGGAK